jgi:hypothetical protein
MEEVYEKVDEMTDTEIELLLEKLKSRIIIPFYISKDDVVIILDNMLTNVNDYKDEKVYPLLRTYNGLSDEDKSKMVEDVLRFLIEKNEETETGIYWSYYVDNLFGDLEGFIDVNRNWKIEQLLS